jgi:hypothetical protein
MAGKLHSQIAGEPIRAFDDDYPHNLARRNHSVEPVGGGGDLLAPAGGNGFVPVQLSLVLENSGRWLIVGWALPIFRPVYAEF